MSNRKNPETSLEAYRSLDVSQLNEIYRWIIQSLTGLGEATFEEIASDLRIDKSRVWKRMSELERMELVYRPGNKRLLKSGRNGYTWRLTSNSLPKTDKQALAYKKGDTTAVDHANAILNVSSKVVQPELFNNASI